MRVWMSSGQFGPLNPSAPDRSILNKIFVAEASRVTGPFLLVSLCTLRNAMTFRYHTLSSRRIVRPDSVWQFKEPFESLARYEDSRFRSHRP